MSLDNHAHLSLYLVGVASSCQHARSITPAHASAINQRLKKEKKTAGPSAWKIILRRVLSQRGLKQIKLLSPYNPSRPDGRLRYYYYYYYYVGTEQKSRQTRDTQ